MSVAIDTLPWSAIELRETEIPWNDLRQLADAAVESPEARDRLKRELDRCLERQYADDESDFESFADLAVPAVFALAAERMDAAGRSDTARYFLQLLCRAAAACDDYLLEAIEHTAGRLGPALVEPTIEMIESTGANSDDWYYLWSFLVVAKDADEATQERVLQLCRSAIHSSRDLDSYWSTIDAPSHVLAMLDPKGALPLLRNLSNRTRSYQVRELISELEGKIEPMPPEDRYPWLQPVEDWLPEEVEQARYALTGAEVPAEMDDLDEFDDDYEAFDGLGVRDDVHDLEILADADDMTIGHVFDSASPDARRPPHDDAHYVTAPIRGRARSAGRNDPCPCGSGAKYKKCCGK